MFFHNDFKLTCIVFPTASMFTNQNCELPKGNMCNVDKHTMKST